MSNGALKMPMWQKQELDKRYEEYKKGKLKLHTLEDIHKGLRKKYK